MTEWLKDGIEDGFARLESHANQVGLVNTDESTFRAFVMAAIKEQRPDALLQSEWHKFDLCA